MSFGHCLGMCGPLVGAFALAQVEPGRSRWRLLVPLLLFQSGRVASYAAIGAAVGAVGAAATLAGAPRAVSGVVSLVAGAAMLAAGASLLGVLPLSRWLEAMPAGRGVAAALGRLLAARRWSSRFLLGVANGFLPCGPVAAAAIAAAGSGAPASGALAMVAYGAGTVPALVAFGLGAGAISPRARLRLLRFGVATVLLVGVQLALRGLHALSVVPGFALGPVVLW